MTTRGVFKLSSYRFQELQGDGVPIDNVWYTDKLQQKGYVIGGMNASNTSVSNYNQLNYDTDTRTNVASLPVGKEGLYGTASPTSGYTYGGRTYGSPIVYYSSSNKLVFATETHTELPGTRFIDAGNGYAFGGSCGSQTHGYICGGHGPSEPNGYSRLDKMTYATETIERIPGANMPGPGQPEYENAASADGDTAGYWVGGAQGAGSAVKKLVFAYDGWSSLPNLPGANPLNRAKKAGMSSSNTGAYLVGGSNPYNSRVQKITFATGNSAIVANSTVPTPAGRIRLTGTGNASSGYFCGGTETSIVEKMNFSTNSMSRIPAMDLVQGVNDPTSMSAAADNKVAPVPKRWIDNAVPGGTAINFDGNDKLYLSANSDMDVNNGDFTIECWFKVNNNTTHQSFITDWNNSGWQLEIQNSKCQFAWGPNSTAYWSIVGSQDVVSSTWNHIAVVRSGDVFTQYLNGTYDGTFTSSAAGNTHGTVNIAYNNDNGASRYVTGSISNVRIVKGTAVYNSNFTVPTEPLTAIAGTGLLCCNQGSPTGATKTPGPITVSGDPTSSFHADLKFSLEPTATPTKQTVDQYTPSLSNNGYWLGGKENPGPSGNRAAKINYATDTASGLPNVPLRAQFQGGMSSSTYGYSVAGYDEVPDGAARYKSNVYKVQYSTDSYSWQGTYPAGKILGMVGVSAGTDHGYGAGGFDTGGSSSNPGGRSSIHKFTFATHTWATIPDKLAQEHMPNSPTPTPKRGSSGGNREYGYFVAMDSASSPGRWGQMTKIAYSTDTTYGSLPKFTHNGVGGNQGLSDTSTSSSKTAMYTLGNWLQPGPSPSKHSSQFEKWTFSTDTMALLPSSTPGLVSSSSNTASGNWEAGYHNGAEQSKKIVYATETTTQNPSTAFTSSNIPASPRVYSEGVAVSARNSDGGKETVPVVC